MEEIAKKSPEQWVKAAWIVLEKQGVEAIRVEPLARVLGVTKGSFYWHFRDRQHLLTSVLEYWEEQHTLAMITIAERGGIDSLTKLSALWNATTGEGLRLDAELAIRNWGKRDQSVEEVVLRVDQTRLKYLCKLLKDMGFSEEQAKVRSFMLYSLLLGNYFFRSVYDPVQRRLLLSQAIQLIIHAPE
jgi:AcrR family transcriptional regulator